MRILLTEMSSRVALTRLFGIKTAFWTKNMKSEHMVIFILKILTLRVIEKMHIKRNTALTKRSSENWGFSATVVSVCIFKLCYKESKSS